MASNYFLNQNLMFSSTCSRDTQGMTRLQNSCQKFMPKKLSHCGSSLWLCHIGCSWCCHTSSLSPQRACLHSGLTYREHPARGWLQQVAVVSLPGGWVDGALGMAPHAPPPSFLPLHCNRGVGSRACPSASITAWQAEAKGHPDVHL